MKNSTFSPNIKQAASAACDSGMAWTAQDASRAVRFTVGFCVPAAGTAAGNLGISIGILELLFQMDVSNIPLQALYEFLQHCQMSPEMGQLQQ